MKQIAQYDVEVLNDESISEIFAPFKGRHVKILVEEIDLQERPLTQHEIYQKVMEAAEAFKGVGIDPNINLSDLANDVNL